MGKLLSVGTKTKLGVVAGVLYVGERYYFMLSKDQSVSLMPATTVEAWHKYE